MSDSSSSRKESSGDTDDSGQADEKLSVHINAPSISDFKILKPISRGAFGKVFLGKKKDKDDQLYAIKVMKKNDMINKNMVKQVIAERDALAVSKSPSIVRLFYSLQSKENIYLVMEYMIGGDVKSLLGMYGYFDEDMAVRYIAEVIYALEYLHSHSIIHRDLKPDNMLISDKGHIKLTDFGLSKINLNRQIGICDIVNTPCARKMDRSLTDYFRTPGQVLSLTSSLGFTVMSKKSQRMNSHVWSGPGTPCTPLGSGSGLRASTPQYNTPPPIKALTPTLQESVHWKSTTSAEQSTSNFPRSISTMSELTEDDVFTPGIMTHKPGFMTSQDEHIRPLSDVSNTIDNRDVHSQPVRTRNADSNSSNDDDTPHLYRSKQSLQESYAAKHLRSMREGSSEPEGIQQLGHFEKDFLRRNESVSSIEVHRHRDMSATDSPLFPSMTIPVDESPPNTSCSSFKKRPFSSVERSPLQITRASTNLTMEFEGFAIGDEHRRKRIIRNIESRVQQKSSHKIHRLRSLNCRFSKSKSKSRLGRKKSENKSSLGSSLSSPSGSNLTVDSLMYMGSVSSMGSSTTSSPYQFVPMPKDSCDMGPPSTPLPESKTGSPMVTSSPLRRQDSGKENKPSFRVNISKSSGFYSQAPMNVIVCQSPGLSTDNSLGTGGHFLSMDISPCSELKHKSTLDSDILKSSPSSGSDIIAQPLPKTPDSTHNPNLSDLNPDFKTPSPVNPRNTYASPTQFRNSDLESSLSMGEDFGLKKLFFASTDLSSDTSENNELDSSFHELSIGGRKGSIARQCSDDSETTKVASSCSAVSSSTVATLTPNGVSKLENSGFEKERCVKPSAMAGGKVKNKLLKRVTTFMSLPVSSGASDGDESDGARTPAYRGKGTRRNFMTPGLARIGLTPMRTPKTINRRPLPDNDDTGRILGTPDYLAPELLLRKEHSYGVDMWALGVCLYEFLTGIPPFNDVSPDLVFQHILSRDLEWPEGEEALSDGARSTIEMLLNPDPITRPSASDVKDLELFSHIDWEHLQEAEMPFVPDPDDAMDTCYFEARNNLQNLEVSAVIQL